VTGADSDRAELDAHVVDRDAGATFHVELPLGT
jgi:hypothetical protein